MQEPKECRFKPWVGKIPWRRAWQPTPVFLHGESHGQRSLLHYSPWDSLRPVTDPRLRGGGVRSGAQHVVRLSTLGHFHFQDTDMLAAPRQLRARPCPPLLEGSQSHPIPWPHLAPPPAILANSHLHSHLTPSLLPPGLCTCYSICLKTVPSSI